MTEIECPKCKHTWEDGELVHVDNISEEQQDTMEIKNDNDQKEIYYIYY